MLTKSQSQLYFIRNTRNKSEIDTLLGIHNQ